MRNVLSVLIVGAATTLTMAAAPAAHAAGDTITGGCFDRTVVDPVVTNGENQGVIGDSSVTRNAGLPVFADVLCYIRIDGAEASGTKFYYTGTGVQSGSNQIAYTATASDVVELCQDVVFADGFDTGVTCQPA